MAVQKILSHRIVNNKYSFLVKWKDGDIDSWVPEADFNNLELVNKYKSELVKGPGTRSKKKLLSNLNLSLITLFFFSLILPFVSCQEESHIIKYLNVPFCSSKSEKQPVMLSKICGNNPSSRDENYSFLENWLKNRAQMANNGGNKNGVYLNNGKNFSTSTPFVTKKSEQQRVWINPRSIKNNDSFTLNRYKRRPVDMPNPVEMHLEVYAKLEHNVIGKGHECKISYVEWTFSENFWGTRFASSIKHNPILNDYDCIRMI